MGINITCRRKTCTMEPTRSGMAGGDGTREQAREKQRPHTSVRQLSQRRCDTQRVARNHNRHRGGVITAVSLLFLAECFLMMGAATGNDAIRPPTRLSSIVQALQGGRNLLTEQVDVSVDGQEQSSSSLSTATDTSPPDPAPTETETSSPPNPVLPLSSPSQPSPPQPPPNSSSADGSYKAGPEDGPDMPLPLPLPTNISSMVGVGQGAPSTGAADLSQLIASVVGKALDTPAQQSPLVKGYLVSQQNASATPITNFPWPSFGVLNVNTVDNMEGMVTPKGYSIERHEVITVDSYKIVSFRIPRGRNTKPNGIPVLLVHGISLSSTCWVVNQPDESLAFILADQGYDVWMMNTRGNTFSNGHLQYSDKQSRYWAFSADEMALYDLPATIDYMLQVTGFKQITFVGHSQGGGLMLALLAKRPEYNDRISVNVQIAPVVHAKYVQSPILVSFFRSVNVTIAASLLPPQEFFYMSGFVQQLFLGGACQVPVTIPSCVMATEGMFGVSAHITTLQYKRYWQAWPSSTSYWNALQWAQMYNEPQAKFMQFNYGPEYNLSNVKAPTIMFHGGNDVLAAPKDISLTISKLTKAGCMAGDNFQKDYGHMDFIWDSYGAKQRVYPVVLKALETFPPQSTKVTASAVPDGR